MIVIGPLRAPSVLLMRQIEESLCWTSVLYLGVKGIALQLVLALELPGVHLVHRQLVFSSFKDLGLINLITSGELGTQVPSHCNQKPHQQLLQKWT